MPPPNRPIRTPIDIALIVDDRPFSRRLLSSMLHMLNCRQVLCAANESEVQSVLTLQPVDIVLLDWHLASIEATSVLAMIRNADDPKIARLPVLIVTGRANRNLVEKAVNHRANGVLIKPCSVKTFDQGMRLAIKQQRGRWPHTGKASLREMPIKSQPFNL